MTGNSAMLTNAQRKNIEAMGTIRAANPAQMGTMAPGESTMGSDFDANNRTMES